jgi:hypothetical protein
MEGYYYKPRMDWELLAVPRRADRHHRLPRRPRAAVAAAGRREGALATPAGCRRSSARTTSSSSCRTTGCRRSARPTRSSSRSPARSARR